jgi:hypothetical protein
MGVISVARHVRDARIEGRDARRRLPMQSEPHWRAIVQGVHVGYYEGRRSTAWVVGWASLRAATANSISASRTTCRQIGAAAFRLCETGRVRRPAGAAGGRRDLRLRRRQAGADPGGPSRAGPMRRARPLGQRSPLSAPWRRRAPRACPSSTPCRTCAPMAGTLGLAPEERPRPRYPNLAGAKQGQRHDCGRDPKDPPRSGARGSRDRDRSERSDDPSRDASDRSRQRPERSG